VAQNIRVIRPQPTRVHVPAARVVLPPFRGLPPPSRAARTVVAIGPDGVFTAEGSTTPTSGGMGAASAHRGGPGRSVGGSPGVHRTSSGSGRGGIPANVIYSVGDEGLGVPLAEYVETLAPLTAPTPALPWWVYAAGAVVVGSVLYTAYSLLLKPSSS